MCYGSRGEHSLSGVFKCTIRAMHCIQLLCRSAHSNAYLYGFWKNKRIVLFDTLIQDGLIEKGIAQCSPNEEDVQVVASEENKVEQKPEQKVCFYVV